MSNPRAATVLPHPRLFRQVGYRADLEFVALVRLTEGSPEGCRTALEALLVHLDSSANGTGRQVSQLLLDVLHKVNRQVHGPRRDEVLYQANRVVLIERFAGCRELNDARRRFRACLAQLLPAASTESCPRHPTAARAIAYIEENYQRRIFLSSVAMALNISPNYLSRLFRRETGATLTAYIQRRRLDHARVLLVQGRHSLSEIAYRVGYQNYRDFYRNFVKYENASPREVRRRLGEPARS